MESIEGNYNEIEKAGAPVLEEENKLGKEIQQN